MRNEIPIVLLFSLLLTGSGSGASNGPIHLAVTGGEDLLYGGAWINGKWISASQSIHFLPSPAIWSVYNLKGKVGEVSSSSQDGPADEDLEFFNCRKIKAGKTTDFGNLAICGRSPKAIVVRPLTPTADYQNVVQRFLKERGVGTLIRRGSRWIFSPSKPKIHLFCRQDINSDGRPEVLLVAASRTQVRCEDPSPRPEEYTLLLLRYVNSAGKVVNQPLVFINYGEDEMMTCYLTCNLVAVLDIQGDGKTEIVVSQKYYEGEEYLIFEYDGERAEKVLGFGWGL